MKKNIIKCDHCGKILDEQNDYVNTEVECISWNVADLCIGCAKELQDIMEKYIRVYEERVDEVSE